MTTPLALAERVSALEYAVFGEFPATMAAMNHGVTHHYAETVANGEAIAGLRFDMAAFQRSVHRRFDAVRADMDQRFEAVDRRFDTVDQRFEGLDAQLRDLRVDMDTKLDTILSELRKPAD